ncbi:hypothetical protein GOP47_0030580 [Adiantum capillus-veneris]|nr:hypothetical protein GOP47_0030580 [Adiantum capillus-veneris]
MSSQRPFDMRQRCKEHGLHFLSDNGPRKLSSWSGSGEAGAIIYQSERETNAQRLVADAEAYANMKRADTNLGIYQEMGHINAEAIKGLNPKISIWDTTSKSGSRSLSSAYEQFSNIYKSIPPLLTTIQDHTGVTPAPFLATLPNTNQDTNTSSTNETVKKLLFKHVD